MPKIWRQLAVATNWPVVAAITVLCTMGIVSVRAYEVVDGNKQFIFALIGFGCLLLMQAIGYVRIGRLAWGLYLLSLLLLIYTVIGWTHVPKLDTRLLRVPHKGGAYKWINLGYMLLQPSELTKVAFCMVLARYLRFRSNYRSVGGLIAPFVFALVPVFLILKQPDLGTAMIFIPALLVMLFAAGARMRHLLAVVAMGLVLVPVAWFSGDKEKPVFRHMPALIQPYQRDRVKAMFSQDPAANYQQTRALVAFGSGGWTGRGIGNIPAGRQVPEAHNDMIFALIGEQFGFVGAIIVLGAYLVLFGAGLEIAASTKEPFGRLTAIGIVAILASQAFFNLMVCLRMMPVTGITLPFVSYGGSSMLASFIAVGLLLNIGQHRPLMIGGAPFEF